MFGFSHGNLFLMVKRLTCTLFMKIGVRDINALPSCFTITQQMTNFSPKLNN